MPGSGHSTTIEGMQKVVEARIAGRAFELSRAEVVARLRAEVPAPVRDHFVVVDGLRYPPKQVIAIVTGLDRADFTTYQARGALRRLGFTTGRASTRAGTVAASSGAVRDDRWGEAEAEVLRPHRGRVVAVAGSEVVTSGDSLTDVFTWLERHDRTAESVFRVPLHPAVDLGGFPG